MEMEKVIVKMFVKTWSDEKVQCKMIEENVIREFDIKPLFEGMNLFYGKNVWIEITREQNATIYTNFESKENKLIQIYKYLIRGRF